MQNGAASWQTLWQFLKWSTVIIWLHFHSLLCNQEITPIIVHKYSQKQYSWELLSRNNAHVHHETDEILFGNRRELRTNTCYWYNMNNPCKHCAITKDYILYDSLCKVLFSVLSNSLWPHGLQPRSPGSSVHGILQARILYWVAILFSRGCLLPRDLTFVSCMEGRFFTLWASREALITRLHLHNPFYRIGKSIETERLVTSTGLGDKWNWGFWVSFLKWWKCAKIVGKIA